MTLQWFDNLVRDIRYAARTLGRSPGLLAVATLSLAVGIGANVVVFSIVESVLLRPFPYRDPNQLVFVWGGASTSLDNHIPASELSELRRRSRFLEAVEPYKQTLTRSMGTQSVRVGRVGRGVFDLLGVRPIVGPGYSPDSGTALGPELVLSYGFWQTHYAGDPSVVGQVLEVNTVPREIVGVMPRGFLFPESDVDMWSPVTELTVFGSNTHLGIARLRPGTRIEEAQAELNVILESVRAGTAGDEPRVARVFPIHDVVVGDYSLMLFLLLGAVGLVLLIASSNVANILLVRGLARRKEFAIRAACGGSRSQLAAQVLTESVLLAAIAGICVLPLSQWGIDLVLGLGLVDIPRIEAASINWRVLIYGGVGALVAAVTAGCLPAWNVSRVELTESLKIGAAQTVLRSSGGRLRDAIVRAQVAVAIVLLVGAGLFVRSAIALAEVDWGFNDDNLSLTVGESMSLIPYNPRRTRDLVESVLENLRQIPGVQSVSAGVSAPLAEGNAYATEYVVGGEGSVNSGIAANNFIVAPGYFETLGVAVQGRRFEDIDPFSGIEGIILNESLADRMFRGADPIGRTVHLAEASQPPELEVDPERERGGIIVDNVQAPDAYSISEDTRRVVIGVASDFRMSGDLGRDSSEPAVYTDYRRVFDSEFSFGLVPMRPNKFLIRSTEEFQSLMEVVRTRFREVDPDIVLRHARMEDLVSRGIGGAGSNRLLLSLSAVFGGLSLLLATVGIYGSMSHAVSQRTSELGIRMALGAQRPDLLLLVMKRGVWLIVPGIVCGLLGAWAATRLFGTLLFGVEPTDGVTFIAVSLLFSTVAFGACLVTALRAIRVDPLIATRCE